MRQSEIPAMERDELKQQFGERVQALRKRQGLTQEELAEAIEKSVDQISNIERGATSTRLDTALAIATALKVALPDLFAFPVSRTEKKTERERLLDDLVALIGAEDEETIRAMSDLTRVLLKKFKAREPEAG
jgi:transcriptional regulator with XRE-family HTH domain